MELYRKACDEAGHHGPGLFQPIIDERGQPLIGQLDYELTDMKDSVLDSGKLVKAKHLFAGGLLAYTGNWNNIDEGTLDLPEEVSAVSRELFTPGLTG